MYILHHRLTADLFDDELVIANLDTGLYYTLSGSIIEILNQLPIENIIEIEKLILSLYPDADITNFKSVFTRLLEEQLIVNVDKIEADQPKWNYNTKSSYQNSVLNKYADMQDLLILDPVHEIDEEGWPVVESSS